MIFNHCIYGNIDKTEGSLTITIYERNNTNPITKTINDLSEGKYQFNLGDFDLLGININERFKDLNNTICIIEYFNQDDDKYFSEGIIINTNSSIQEFNITTSQNIIESIAEPTFSVSENLIKTQSQFIKEPNTDIYSYFETLYDINDDDTFLETILQKNSDFSFSPIKSGKYKILQRGINKLNNIVTEKDYIFNAIVSGTSITRSTKCKSINDSIKILFQGVVPSESPSIRIIIDEDEASNGTMASEGKDIYSYNYTFVSDGYYCFEVSVGDEVFLINYKVNKASLRVYYVPDSKNEGLTLPYNVYFINDVNNSLLNSTLIEISSGLYVSEEINVDYGDYLIEVENNELEEYVIKFEECISIENEGTNKSSANEEEIYWVFSSNLGEY